MEANEEAMDIQTSVGTDPNLAKFKQFHDEAYLYVDMGLTCDSQQQAEQAVILYTKGLHCLDQALAIDHTGPHCVGPQWDKVKVLVKKMNVTKGRIESRKNFLIANDSAAARMINDPPPSYEVSISPTGSECGVGLQDGASSLATSPADATALLVIPDGVQIFFISADGAVTAPSYPASLAVYCFDDRPAMGVAESPPAFLQVGDWVYPLIPGRSPVLRSDYGAYMFPDLSAEEQVLNSFKTRVENAGIREFTAESRTVGLMIPDSVPAEQKSMLDDLLHSFTEFRAEDENSKGQQSSSATADRRASVPSNHPQRPPPPSQPCSSTALRVDRRTSEPARHHTQHVHRQEQEQEPTSVTISKGLVTGAEWISWGLRKGAEKTGELMKKGSSKLREQIQPNSQATPIDPRAQQAVKVTKEVAGAAVTVSAFLISALGKATMALGREVAPHVKKYGKELLPKSVTKKEPGGRSKLDDVVVVAAGGLKGFGTVWIGLEHAASALAKSITNETVSVVQHKYGRDAGQLTENGMYAAGGAAITAYHISAFGLKAIAKRTAKDMGKATVEHMDQENRAKQRRRSQDDDEDDDGSTGPIDKSVL